MASWSGFCVESKAVIRLVVEEFLTVVSEPAFEP